MERCSCGDQRQEVAEDLQSDVARLLRVKLHAADMVALDGRGERPAVRGGRHAVGGDRRGERVREVDLRAVSDAVEEPRCRVYARARSSRRAAPSPSTAAARIVPLISPRPGNVSRLVARPRTATACRGRCRAAAAPPSSACRIASPPSPSSGVVARSGRRRARRSPRAVARSAGVRGREELRAERREALAHRGQIAGAVVDEGNHNKPLRARQHAFASCLSFAHATRSARANALKTASMW